VILVAFCFALQRDCVALAQYFFTISYKKAESIYKRIMQYGCDLNICKGQGETHLVRYSDGGWGAGFFVHKLSKVVGDDCNTSF